MTENLHHDQNPSENDPLKDVLKDLLQRDAVAYEIVPSPWFATQTAAKALQTPQSHGIFSSSSLLRRILLPIPLAALAAMMMLALHYGPQNRSSLSFVSSEDEFEQHMEMLASTE